MIAAVSYTHLIAIEPMICQYDCKITQSKDGWTVKTKDGGLAAHFEHSNAILKLSLIHI